MIITNWIPAISTTVLFAFLLWLLRSWIFTRLTKEVQHEFNVKLEALRTDQRKSEESFRSELRNKETQIAILRDTAVSGLVDRQASLYKKRIEAAEQIWVSVIELGTAKAASAWMVHIKFKEATREAAQNPQFRTIFDTISASVDLKKIGVRNTARWRPFLSETVWATFSAYQSILLFAVMQVNMLKQGLDVPDILTDKTTTKLLKAVLPHYSEYLDQFGSTGYHFLLEDLESILLKELKDMINGVEVEQNSIERAAIILKASDEVMKRINN